jgi:uncharacterized protein with HEPN domain
MKQDLPSLLDMLQSAEMAIGYIAGRTLEDFTTDSLFQDAVIRRCLIIGEASRRISEETKQSLPNIPWKEINGMRNRLVHEYDELNITIVWDTVVNSLPNLVIELEKAMHPDE